MSTKELGLPIESVNRVAELDGERGSEIGSKPYASEQETFRWRLFVTLGLLIPFLGVVIALVRLWFVGPVWSDFIAFGVMYFISGFGITVGYHRLLTHRSFVVPRWLYLTFAVMGSLSLIGPAAIWVATHRRHHAFADRDGDPHSPHHPHNAEPKTGLARWRAIAHGYVGWLYTPDYSPLERWAPELLKDRALMTINDRFLELAVFSFLAPGVAVFAVTHTVSGFLGALLWGGLVRICVSMNGTFFVNTFCHVIGDRPFKTRDQSRNLWPLALISLGDSWHNNHHAWPSAAISGIGPWQIDPSGALIRLLEFCGLARDVKRIGMER
jgi:stearoyl-CoA desaturase (Delta-9 desaturase)